jgi:hypothetical protein
MSADVTRLRPTKRARAANPDQTDLDDETLAIMLVRLYVSEMDPRSQPPQRTETTQACKHAIQRRMTNGQFGRYISRLVRDIYLSETALEAGLGIEEAFDFWHWFDRRMWPSPQAWYREAHEPGPKSSTHSTPRVLRPPQRC